MTFTPPMAFAGAPLDLVENERSEADLTAFAKARKARALIMHHGQFLTKNGELVMIAPMKMVGKNIYDPGPLFLGLDGNAPIFAFSFADPVEALDMTNNANLEPLRGLAAKLDPKQLALAGRAKSLFDWHRAHKFCSNCGNQSYVTNGGVTRKCPSCETDHFPRVNPVVIMLVLHGDKCLLGRGPQWPEGAYSCLAGFVSPGETMEEACVREVFEEVGVTVQDMEYRFSQPWPFPSQLMMGLSCQATNTDITLDNKEIADAQWFSKETVRGVFNGTDTAFLCPPAFTIAHQLLQTWLDD
ncbi:MAG: NAD(+) diphosphatase [Robiginitomaculum sp.]|nr:MAG: NAD(+) diphosphatase [Robiginitomaculum sp.]